MCMQGKIRIPLFHAGWRIQPAFSRDGGNIIIVPGPLLLSDQEVWLALKLLYYIFFIPCLPFRLQGPVSVLENSEDACVELHYHYA